MPTSSRATHIAGNNRPSDLDSTHRFGNGYPVGYEAKTPSRYHAYTDHKRTNFRYNEKTFSESAHEEQAINDEAPRLVIPKAANDERSLAPYDRLSFAAEVSIRYHNRRKDHYEKAFRLMMLCVIGMATFAVIAGIGQKLLYGLGIIGIASATLVWNVTQKAREHDVLRSEYQTLLDQIRATTEPTDSDLRNWRNLRLRIQTKEPAVFWAVANECYYDVARAWDLDPRDRGAPPVMLRIFSNWFRF